MASPPSAALFLVLNLLFFSLVASSCKCPPTPKHKSPPPKKHAPKPCPPPPPPPPPKKHTRKPCPPPPGTYHTPSTGKCPIDALKLGVCANVLNGLINVVIGTPPNTPCCTLIEGLADLEAAVCLCTAIKANVLGIHLKLPVSLSLLVNYCGKKVPAGFQCP